MSGLMRSILMVAMVLFLFQGVLSAVEPGVASEPAAPPLPTQPPLPASMPSQPVAAPVVFPPASGQAAMIGQQQMPAPPGPNLPANPGAGLKEPPTPQTLTPFLDGHTPPPIASGINPSMVHEGAPIRIEIPPGMTPMEVFNTPEVRAKFASGGFDPFQMELRQHMPPGAQTSPMSGPGTMPGGNTPQGGGQNPYGNPTPGGGQMPGGGQRPGESPSAAMAAQYQGLSPQAVLASLSADGCWGPCKQTVYEQLVASTSLATDSKIEKSEAVITTGTLAALVKARTQMTILDARGEAGLSKKRIPGSKPLSTQTTAEEIQKTIPDRTMLVITYADLAAAQEMTGLAAKLRTLGYVNVIEYREGLDGWIAAGEATE